MTYFDPFDWLERNGVADSSVTLLPIKANGHPVGHPVGVPTVGLAGGMTNGLTGGATSGLTGNPASNPAPPTSQSHDERTQRIRRAAAYISGIAGAISGQDGSGQTFDAACALVKGFGLSIDDARPILQEWNGRCQPPWSTEDLEHKLQDADKKSDDKPRGYLFEGESRGWADRPENLGKIYGAALKNGTNGTPEYSDYPTGQEDDPHRLARLFLDERYRHTDGITLRFWREDFHAWQDSHYSPIPGKEMAAEVTNVIEAEFQRIYDQAVMIHAMRKQRAKAGADAGNGEQSGPPRKRPVTKRIVADVIQAISDMTLLRVRICPDQPAWLNVVHAPWPAREILPAQNALIHLPSFIDGVVYMKPPTPTFFSSYSLDYPFDPESGDPVEWLRFLDQLWIDDLESVATLQEWIGYLLTPDTSQQKILMMIGPKRSGKGTIVRVIRALIGLSNVVNPTLSGLANQFGLASLIGKTAAIVTDARISGRTDTAVVIERLLSISGEDAQDIDRKYRESVDLKLSTRFMIVSNELPKVSDASGALAGRMLFLRLTRSFYGQEDTHLLDKLLPELSSILLWAIKGWARLRERGHFVQPQDGADLASAMEDLSSPVKAFIRDTCRVGTGEEYEVPTANLYQSWKNWCSAKGQEKCGIEEEFGRNLRAALPEVKKIHPRKDGVRIWCYSGLRILEEWETNSNKVDEEDREFSVPF